MNAADHPCPRSEGLRMTVLLDTDDLDLAEAEITTLWPHFRVKPDDHSGVTRTRIDRTSLGSIRVDDVEFGYDASFHFQPADYLQLMCVRSGVVDYEQPDGELIRFGPGRAG